MDAKIIRDLIGIMKQESNQPTAYDTAATVNRIEGSTAWVHIPGGIDETPVELSINAKAGDTVRVRVSGGQAWLTGNNSAPPTDDKKANEASIAAEKALIKANEAKESFDGLGQEEIFNRLTNNGQDQGIYRSGNKIYLNFEYAVGQTLKLGGVGNTNGLIELYDSDNVNVGKWDKDGLNIIDLSTPNIERTIEIEPGFIKARYIDSQSSFSESYDLNFNGAGLVFATYDPSDQPVVHGYLDTAGVEYYGTNYVRVFRMHSSEGLRLSASTNSIVMGVDSNTGAFINLSAPSAWREALGINDTALDFSPPAVNAATATDTTIYNTGQLTPGTYIITFTAEFAGNANGNTRIIYLATSPTGSVVSRNARTSVHPAGGNPTRPACTFLTTITANTTFYLRVYQDSGSTLSVTGGMSVLKIH